MQDHDEAATEEDDRNIAELLLDQIEFADVILLNKKDLVPDRKTQEAILATIKTLNPQAQIKFTTKCKVGARSVRSYVPCKTKTHHQRCCLGCAVGSCNESPFYNQKLSEPLVSAVSITQCIVMQAGGMQASNTLQLQTEKYYLNFQHRTAIPICHL